MIRSAEVTDVPQIYKLLQQGAKEGDILKRKRESIRRSVNQFIVYEVDHTIVGCCALHRYTSRIAEIRSLYVDPSMRGNGIARELVREQKQKAREMGVERVFAITGAKTVFEKEGFDSQVGKRHIVFTAF